MSSSGFKSMSSRRPSSSSSSSSSSTTTPTQSTKHTHKHNDPSQKKAPLRRSRSVSAFSRTTQSSDVTLDFNNTRDNPLFWVDWSPRDSHGDKHSLLKLSKFHDVVSTTVNTSSLANGSSNSFNDNGRRGRTVSRSSATVRSFSVVGNGSGRSMSRSDTGRTRRCSPSRGPCGNLQRGREQNNGFSSDARSKHKTSSNSSRGVSVEKKKSVGSASDLPEVLKSWNTWSSQHPATDAADDSPRSLLPRWDDGGSTGSVSEVEEKTIIPVSEVKKKSHWMCDSDTNGESRQAVRMNVRRTISNMQDDLNNTSARSSPEILNSGILSDFAPEVENLNADELLEGFRDDFARELEECEERARKLRAELAVEEHRELELSKILNDIVPEPGTPQVQKPRGVRRASMERRKVSKRLEEEAMAYFDECVSISTFDDSDFSSLEDPLSCAAGADGAYSSQFQDLWQSQLMQCAKDSGLASNTSCNDSLIASSLSSSKMKTRSVSISLEQDLKNHVKTFSKDCKRESINSGIAQTARTSTEECRFQAPVEQLMLDRAIFRSRIESGCMLLCGASFGLPGAPFA